ncbi:hypothetical protein ACIU1J_18110 [Azospirillum doebereinerae]|uniref:hypothetical protein n=1 Tax=Azospirillum doebereinerae TaxID=92933 RepID=UPI001EE62E50|nr:hypothetical protein [Azospirillum doebereinerae]MCG5242535.1 hypothetical protein [Azospirillum doebereinerae]
MTRFAALAALCLTVGLTAAGPARADLPAPAATFIGNATALAQALADTRYVHETSVQGAVIRPLGGGRLDIDADCSGWVSHNLERLPLHYEALRQYQPQVAGEAGRPYPRATVYRQYFASLPAGAPFQAVKTLAAAQPGDILSWCLPGHCGVPYSGKPADDTGHVMVVLSKPIPNDARSAFLMVLDASSVTHYSFATLPEAVKAKHPELNTLYANYPTVRDRTEIVDGKTKTVTSGVGPGFILFGTNPDGSVGSFQFGPGDRTNSEGIGFAIGRPVPMGR